ncbi:hypothetical protein HDF19_08065 [Mucilaginibacter sp. E4BP6]|uniref:hypothetical protein n=1 Tax=Mucilaginibacter sp. E4BP6 TaxID=2723089 RepID=UPI0015CB3F30|nr:hypothetical protein [Mucilaginibacter sp. E4BP6]NYE67565.1 hypothetical protein [Mucilaginibacter sp. E4BP6]
MKNVLIISPYFAPSNAADMQRIRMSLPYFKQFGWVADVVTVDDKYSEMIKDELLFQSLPPDVNIYKVKALSKKITAKVGLGSLALRSMWYYLKTVNQLLKATKYDLIYFSTTQFPVTILGAYWRLKFKTPYIIDVQDPWYSEYYQDKPKDQRPAKYWFSYRLNKYLEPIAMNSVGGLISVSDGYIDDLKSRYPTIKNIPAVTIPFGAFKPDLQIAADNEMLFKPLLNPEFKNVIYIGRGGADMQPALNAIFKAFKSCLDGNQQLFKNIQLYFVGTSYAPAGQGKPTILPIAQEFGVAENVIEITDRISYYHTLATLQQADALLMPGSDDPQYTASKIYPYLLTTKPLLAVFNSKSPALDALKEYGAPFAYSYDGDENIQKKISSFFSGIANDTIAVSHYNADAINKYSAQNMTKLQCQFFEEVLSL